MPKIRRLPLIKQGYGLNILKFYLLHYRGNLLQKMVYNKQTFRQKRKEDEQIKAEEEKRVDNYFVNKILKYVFKSILSN